MIDVAAITTDNCVGHFAEAAVYTPAGGYATAVKVIFDKRPEVVEVGSEMPVTVNVARCEIVPGDPNLDGGAAIDPGQEDLVTIRGTEYRVANVEHDLVAGTATLTLRERA